MLGMDETQSRHSREPGFRNALRSRPWRDWGVGLPRVVRSGRLQLGPKWLAFTRKAEARVATRDVRSAAATSTPTVREVMLSYSTKQ
jgi:hypothetical protein